MSIFEHISYKNFVREWTKGRPKRGHGEYRRMAEHLRVSSTMISQVFGGEKELNLEVAAELTEYLGLNRIEEDYFFLLIEFERAGSKKLKAKLRQRIEDSQLKASKVAERVEKHGELDGEKKAIYYSTWMYTGIRNLVALSRSWADHEIAEKLKVAQAQVRTVVQFLLESGLLGLTDGHYEVLAKATHLSAESPLVLKHHQNWRLRGFVKMDYRDPNDLFYTGPMSLSHTDAQKVRSWFLDLIQQINKMVVESPSETVRCLNLDWFEY